MNRLTIKNSSFTTWFELKRIRITSNHNDSVYQIQTIRHQLPEYIHYV